MDEKELALKIGEHVLDVFDEYTKKPLGLKVVVPNMIPRSRSRKEFEIIYPRFSDWVITVEVQAPYLQMAVGPGEYKIISAKEYFKMAKKMGIE